MLPSFAEPVLSPGYDKALSKDDAPGNFFPGSFINFRDSCPGNVHLGSTLFVSFLLQIYQTASDSLGHSSGEKDSYWGAWQILRHLGGLGIYVTSLFSTYVDYKPEEEKIQY